MNYVREILEDEKIRYEAILDIGCWNDGFPTYTAYAIERSHYYMGIDKDFLDMDESDLKNGLLGAPTGLNKTDIDTNWKVKFELRYLDLNIHALKFRRFFDLILIINVLHFFEESKVINIIDRCYNLLKPGGSIIAQISNRDRGDYVFFKNEEDFKQIFIKKAMEQVYAGSDKGQVIVHFCKSLD